MPQTQFGYHANFFEVHEINYLVPRKRFLADGMLGSLCRWLRILGFECELASREEDDALVKRALGSGLILLTRDAELLGKASDYVRCALVPEASLRLQIAWVAHEFKLSLPRAPQPRLCPACGSALKRLRKSLAKERVFARIYERNRNFWSCSNKSCNAIYWKGSHWQSISAEIDEIRKLMKGRPAQAPAKQAF
jgi:uncharacterized protein with PIN domain